MTTATLTEVSPGPATGATAGRGTESGRARPAALRARALTRTYGHGAGAFTALRGIDLTVEHGESVAVVGRSGSGKSTLMHLLALLDRPTTGNVEVRGQDATTLTSSELDRVRASEFGFVFQQFFLVPRKTVLENVTTALSIAGAPRRTRRTRAMEALERLGLADKAGNRATDLSGGQKQRVAIARALVNEPSVLFADEPTGNLDSVIGGEVEDVLFDLQHERDLTLVVVTHDPALAQRCARTVELADGRIVTDSEVAR